MEFCIEKIHDKCSGIYKITSDAHGMVYIGSAVNLKKRFWTHRAQLRNKYHHSRVLQNIYNKYGEHSLKMLLVCLCDKTEIAQKEECYLNIFKPLANSHYTYKSSMRGRKHTDETKAKISKMQKGKIGKPISEELKRQISELHKGKKKTEETKRKMSESKKGCGNAMFGIKAKNRRRVIAIYKNGDKVFYESLMEAQENTGADFRNIQAVCAGKRNKANGILFKYADQ